MSSDARLGFFTTPVVLKPHIQNWAVNSQSHLLQQGVHTTNNVVTNRSILTNSMISKTFSTTINTQYAFSMDDITTYSPPTSPGGGISLLIVNYDYTFRVYKGSSTTAFYTTQFNLANATRVLDFVTDATTTQIRIEISRGMAMIQGQAKYVDNLKLRKFTGNTSVYNTNYSNMSITANALDGWSPDNWATTSATVDQAAGQYRLVAIGSGATAKVQREFTALPNQEHRFQYNLSLLNGGSATVHVQQLVGSAYIDVPGVSQTQTSSGTYELSFVPTETDIRISVSGTSRYALNNLYLDRDQIDTLVATYALSRGYRYGFNGMEKDDEAKGAGNSYDFGARMYDSRLGRWLTIDPLAGKYPSLSTYNFVANSPLVFVDPDGKDLIVGGKTDVSVHDIKSLLPEEYRLLITVSDAGKIMFDHSQLPDNIRTYEGVKLLIDMTESKKSYLYSVGDELVGVDRGSNIAYLNRCANVQELKDAPTAGGAILNFSITSRSDLKTSDLENSLPEDGFQGAVSIQDGTFSRVNK